MGGWGISPHALIEDNSKEPFILQSFFIATARQFQSLPLPNPTSFNAFKSNSWEYSPIIKFAHANLHLKAHFQEFLPKAAELGVV